MRVPDEHAGKQARCPKCQNVQAIPAASGSVFDGLPMSPPPKPPPSYAPPPSYSPPSYSPSSYSPGSPPPHSATGNPYADAPAPAKPYSPPASNYGSPYGGAYQQSWSRPHQGNVILVLGILSLVLCQLLGPIAWIMGQNDLREIDRGVMDPSGRSATQAGMILGIIGTVLMVLWCGCVSLATLAGG